MVWTECSLEWHRIPQHVSRAPSPEQGCHPQWHFCSTGRTVKTTPWVPASYIHPCFQNSEVILNHHSEISQSSACPHGWKSWHDSHRASVSRFSASGPHLGPIGRVSLITRILFFSEPPSSAHKLPGSPGFFFSFCGSRVLFLWYQGDPEDVFLSVCLVLFSTRTRATQQRPRVLIVNQAPHTVHVASHLHAKHTALEQLFLSLL